MSFKQRIERLEKLSIRHNCQLKSAFFLIRPRHNTVAYQYGDTIIERLKNESIEAFQQRCVESIAWPEDRSQRVIFKIPA